MLWRWGPVTLSRVTLRLKGPPGLLEGAGFLSPREERPQPVPTTLTPVPAGHLPPDTAKGYLAPETMTDMDTQARTRKHARVSAHLSLLTMCARKAPSHTPDALTHLTDLV